MRQASHHRNDQHAHYEINKDNYAKYRSIVSSVSWDLRKSNMNLAATKSKWIHVGGNILRLPPIIKKYSLVSKVNGRGNSGIHSVAFSPKGRYVALGLSTGEVQIRKLSVMNQNVFSMSLRKSGKNEDSTSPVTCVRFVPSMENILFCSDLSGRIDVFDTEKDCKHILAKENNEINLIDVNMSGTRVISGGKDSVLRVYDAANGKVINATVPIIKRSYEADPTKYHQRRVYCVKFDPENGNVFFSGGLDGYVKMWDIREGLQGVRTLKGPYILGDAIDVWGNVLLTGSWRCSKSLDLWDTMSGQHLETLVPTNRTSSLDGDFYQCVRFFNGGKDGSVILTGGNGTGKFEIFDLMEKRVVFAVKVGNTVKSIDSTLCSIVCGGLDGICRVVRCNTQWQNDQDW